MSLTGQYPATLPASAAPAQRPARRHSESTKVSDVKNVIYGPIRFFICKKLVSLQLRTVASYYI